MVCDGVECESVVEDGEEDDDDDEDEDYADREVGQLTGMSWPEHWFCEFSIPDISTVLLIDIFFIGPQIPTPIWQEYAYSDPEDKNPQ